MSSLYEEMGGRTTFEELVSHFYALVSTDPILRPMYPDEDLKGAADLQTVRTGVLPGPFNGIVIPVTGITLTGTVRIFHR